MHYYMIYGLIVQSELEIEEAYPIAQPEICDVKVCYGTVPADVKSMPERHMNIQYGVNRVAFYIEEVGFFLIENGATIVIEPLQQADYASIKSFLLGSAFGFLLALRNIVAIHGGAVALDKKAVIITGESGAGKSTISDALRETGALFVSDDVCVIRKRQDATLQVEMGYPQQKLCRDAAISAGYDLEKLIYINEDRDKYAVRLKDGFLPEGAPLKAIIEIVKTTEGSVAIEEISGHQKLKEIINNLFRADMYYKKINMPPAYMHQCLEIASKIPFYKIYRPEGIDTKREIVQWILKEI